MNAASPAFDTEALELFAEPTREWVVEALGVTPIEADWLLVLYRFLPDEERLGLSPPRRRYYCEAL